MLAPVVILRSDNLQTCLAPVGRELVGIINVKVKSTRIRGLIGLIEMDRPAIAVSESVGTVVVRDGEAEALVVIR